MRTLQPGPCVVDKLRSAASEARPRNAHVGRSWLVVNARISPGRREGCPTSNDSHPGHSENPLRSFWNFIPTSVASWEVSRVHLSPMTNESGKAISPGRAAAAQAIFLRRFYPAWPPDIGRKKAGDEGDGLDSWDTANFLNRRTINTRHDVLTQRSFESDNKAGGPAGQGAVQASATGPYAIERSPY